MKCCRGTPAPCFQRPHPQPLASSPDSCDHRSLMWPLVPEFSRQNVTQHPMRNIRGVHCLTSRVTCLLQTLLWIRWDINGYEGTRGDQLTKGRQKPERSWGRMAAPCRAGVLAAGSRTQHSPEPPPGVGVEPTAGCRALQCPGPECPEGRSQRRVRGAQGGHGNPGPKAEKHKASWEKGGCRNLRQRQRCFLLCSWEQSVSAPGDVSSEQWPSHAEKCVSWTENKSCSLNGRPMPHPSPSLSEQPPLPFL